MALPNPEARFRVEIDYVHLRTGDGSTSSDTKTMVFLNVNFDHFRKLKTTSQEAETNPVWRDFPPFEYETQQAHRLHRKFLEIEVISKNPDSLSETIVGNLSVNLQTLSLGPTEYDLSLNKSPQWHLRFSVRMEQVTKVQFHLTNIVVKSLPAVDPFISAHGHVTFKEMNVHRIDMESSEANEWAKLPILCAESTLRNLIDGAITFDLYQLVGESNELTYIGYATVHLKPFISLDSSKTWHFRETINNRIASIGIVEGDITLKELPTFAQLKEGIWNDDGLSNTATRLHPELQDLNSVLYPRTTAYGTVYQ